LTDIASLKPACTGSDVIVATANAAMPSRKLDTFETVEQQGYRNLVEAAVESRVRRFVFTSVRLYGRILGATLKIQRTLALVFRALDALLRPFPPMATNRIALDDLAATDEMFPNPAVAQAPAVTPSTAESFLPAKSAASAAAG
jgi:hypothetical protein